MSNIDGRILGTGANIDVEAQVDPTYKALRTSLRGLDPMDVNGVVGGHYRLAAKTGSATVIAAAGAIFSMRWNDSTRAMVVQRIMAGFLPTTAYTAAQATDLDLVKVTGFSGSDTGGTTIAPGAAGKKRSTFGNSLVADARIATTAALGAGTGTADANAMSMAIVGFQAAGAAVTASFVPMQTLFDVAPGQESQLILMANEGFRVRLATTMGAAGVGVFNVVVDWAEVPALSL